MIQDVTYKVYATGGNSNGELCLGNKAQKNSFSEITALNSFTNKVTRLTGADGFVLMKTRNGYLYGCGSPVYVNIGPNSTEGITTPTLFTSAYSVNKMSDTFGDTSYALETPCTKTQNVDSNCNCLTGYSGTNCEITSCNGITSTSSQVCNYLNGTCTRYNTCTCNTGYYGTTCQVTTCNGIYSNSTSACSSHGTCVKKDVCSCDATYSSTFCSATTCNGISSTSTSVCSGHGTCTGYNQCTCSSGWTGTSCNVASCSGIASTSTSVCSGRGTCSAPNTCTCNASWGGAICNVPTCTIGVTNPLYCSQHGSCDSSNNCVCATGYSGTLCEYPVCFTKVSTDATVCSSHGTCLSSNNCTCTSGWTGADCSTPVCFLVAGSSAAVCSGHGNCSLPDTCTCSTGWTGPQCDIPICAGINANNQTVCSSSGNCIGPNTCSCSPGWVGMNCDTFTCSSVSSASATVCSGHGSCIAMDSCICTGSYSGFTCQYPSCYSTLASSSSVCSGHGTCTAMDTCVCSSGYFSSNCSVYSCYGISTTSPSVCSGHGSCIAVDQCACSYGFAGSQCSSDISCAIIDLQATPHNITMLRTSYSSVSALIAFNSFCSPQNKSSLTYSWYQLSGPTRISIATPTAPTLGLYPNTMQSNAKYVFGLSVKLATQTVNETVEVYIVKPQPVAVIGGGNRIVSSLTSFVLNGATSYDTERSTLSYSWYCFLATAALPPCSGIVLQQASNITIQMDPGRYIFALTVSNGALSQPASVLIEVVNDRKLDVSIKSANSKNVLSIDSATTFTATVSSSATQNYKYAWIAKDENNTIVANMTSILSSFSIPRQTFLPGKLYTISVTATDKTSGTTGYTELTVQAATAPANGTISILPSSGTELTTLFTISLDSWASDYTSPLLYSCVFRVNSMTSTMAVAQYDTVVTGRLPAGNVTVLCTVSNEFGSKTTASLVVHVLPQDFRTADALSSIINSTLASVTSNPLEALQTAAASAMILSQMNTASNSERVAIAQMLLDTVFQASSVDSTLNTDISVADTKATVLNTVTATNYSSSNVEDKTVVVVSKISSMLAAHASISDEVDILALIKKILNSLSNIVTKNGFLPKPQVNSTVTSLSDLSTTLSKITLVGNEKQVESDHFTLYSAITSPLKDETERLLKLSVMKWAPKRAATNPGIHVDISPEVLNNLPPAAPIQAIIYSLSPYPMSTNESAVSGMLSITSTSALQVQRLTAPVNVTIPYSPDMVIEVYESLKEGYTLTCRYWDPATFSWNADNCTLISANYYSATCSCYVWANYILTKLPRDKTQKSLLTFVFQSATIWAPILSVTLVCLACCCIGIGIVVCYLLIKRSRKQNTVVTPRMKLIELNEAKFSNFESKYNTNDDAKSHTTDHKLINYVSRGLQDEDEFGDETNTKNDKTEFQKSPSLVLPGNVFNQFENSRKNLAGNEDEPSAPPMVENEAEAAQPQYYMRNHDDEDNNEQSTRKFDKSEEKYRLHQLPQQQFHNVSSANRVVPVNDEFCQIPNNDNFANFSSD